MILTMTYAIAVAALFGVAASFAERIAGELGWPRRAGWTVALVGSIALPCVALFAEPDSDRSDAILSLPEAFQWTPEFQAVTSDRTAETAPVARNRDIDLTWPDLRLPDGWIKWLWIAISAAVGLVLAAAALSLRRMTRRLERRTIDGREVLIADDLGPAVFGALRPRIVIPAWLENEGSGLGSLVLHHEGEHIAARDQSLLLFGLLAVAAMPWNPALWWQLKRLRSAIEVDCDTRVLRRGVDAREYSRALFAVGQRSTPTPLGAVALTETVSELERRIKIMLERTKRFSLMVVGSRLTLVASVSVLALAINAPGAQTDDESAAGETKKEIPTIRSDFYDRFSDAQECLENEDFECAHRVLDSVAAHNDLNNRETAQLYNFRAFLRFEEDDVDAAIRNYESILGLPHADIPDGMIGASMRNVATLYIQEERYDEGLASFDSYMDLPFIDPTAQDYLMKSQVLYTMERYEDAFEPLRVSLAQRAEDLEALEEQEDPEYRLRMHYPDESAHQLLYVLQWQTEDIAGAVETLEILNERWPGEQWSRQLEGARALLDTQ